VAWTGRLEKDLIGRSIASILLDGDFQVPEILRSVRDSGIWAGEIALDGRDESSSRARAWVVRTPGVEPGIFRMFCLEDLNPRHEPDTRIDSLLAEISGQLRETLHQLNSPLAVVMGHTQLILLESDCLGKVRKDIEKVFSEMRRVVQMIEKLHAYALSIPELRSKIVGSAEVAPSCGGGSPSETAEA
jgi:signal transduction histidine kinase